MEFKSSISDISELSQELDQIEREWQIVKESSLDYFTTYRKADETRAKLSRLRLSNTDQSVEAQRFRARMRSFYSRINIDVGDSKNNRSEVNSTPPNSQPDPPTTNSPTPRTEGKKDASPRRFSKRPGILGIQETDDWATLISTTYRKSDAFKLLSYSARDILWGFLEHAHSEIMNDGQAWAIGISYTYSHSDFSGDDGTFYKAMGELVRLGFIRVMPGYEKKSQEAKRYVPSSEYKSLHIDPDQITKIESKQAAKNRRISKNRINLESCQ